MSSTAHALAARLAAPRAAARAAPSRPRALSSFAERATTSGASTGRGAVAVSARFGFGSADDAVADEGAAISRRTLLAGKALFTLGEAFVFPWATEGATRPPSAATADLKPFSPAWLRSVLFVPTEPEKKAAAKAALLRGEALAAQGEHLSAIEQFEAVYATAPTEYKMCQRAGLQTAVSYKAMSQKLGDEFDKKANGAKGVVWWWGRGTRWPGWYIIAYLSGRNVWFTAKDDPVGTFTVTEALGLLVPIWLGLLYTLVTYGIPDY